MPVWQADACRTGGRARPVSLVPHGVALVKVTVRVSRAAKRWSWRSGRRPGRSSESVLSSVSKATVWRGANRPGQTRGHLFSDVEGVLPRSVCGEELDPIRFSDGLVHAGPAQSVAAATTECRGFLAWRTRGSRRTSGAPPTKFDNPYLRASSSTGLPTRVHTLHSTQAVAPDGQPRGHRQPHLHGRHDRALRHKPRDCTIGPFEGEASPATLLSATQRFRPPTKTSNSWAYGSPTVNQFNRSLPPSHCLPRPSDDRNEVDEGDGV